MPSYTAPVDDMMFLFEKLRNNQKYNELEKYKEVTTDLVKDILQEAAKINQNLILPLAKAGDKNPAVLEAQNDQQAGSWLGSASSSQVRPEAART